MKEEKHSYIKGLLHGIGTLLTGMKVTGREFFTPKVTEQYPENRATLKISPRFRGRLIMPVDENGNNKCIACGLCQMACPNDTITITSESVTNEETGKKKKILVKYEYDLGACMFCQLCVNACPHDAIRFDTEFENAVFDRSKLVLTLNKNKNKRYYDTTTNCIHCTGVVYRCLFGIGSHDLTYLACSNLSAVRFIWYSRYLLPAQLLILGSCTITDLRRWYNSALCI